MCRCGLGGRKEVGGRELREDGRGRCLNVLQQPRVRAVVERERRRLGRVFPVVVAQQARDALGADAHARDPHHQQPQRRPAQRMHATSMTLDDAIVAGMAKQEKPTFSKAAGELIPDASYRPACCLDQ